MNNYRVNSIFAASLFTLQIVDIWTTSVALSAGNNSEANPIMFLIMNGLPNYWWVPKIIVAFMVCIGLGLFATKTKSTKKISWIIIILYTMVVLDNLRVIVGLSLM
jgi:Domain of unknown function (DUF5658)